MDNTPQQPEAPNSLTPEPNSAPSPPIQRLPKPRKTRYIIGLIIALLLVAGLIAAFMLRGKDEPSSREAVGTDQAATGDARGVPDEIYLASSYDQSVTFYDAKGTKLRSVSLDLPANYLIGATALGQNNAIQIVQAGQRIFVYAGLTDPAAMGDLGEPEFKSHEIFEVVDGKTQLVYAAPDSEVINDWVVSPDGELLLLKMGERTVDKSQKYAYRVLSVSDKSVKQISDFAPDSETSNNSQLFITGDSHTGGYFTSEGGTLGRVSFDLHNAERSVKNYKMPTCQAQIISWCTVEWPDFVSPDAKRVVYGYQENDRFGVLIIDTENGQILSNYKLDNSIESIGNVLWAPDSSKIVFDIHDFGNEGQQAVGRLNRMLELKVGDNTVSQPLFSMPSPGIADGTAYSNASVRVYGYSQSGNYLVFYNENTYKVLQLDNGSVVGSFTADQVDSSRYIGWVR